MGERPWGASSSVKAMKNSKQVRNRLDVFSSGSRDRANRSSKNHFGVLANLDSEDHFPSLAGTKIAGKARAISSRVLSPQGKSPEGVFREAEHLRRQLLDMTRDQSLGSEGQSAILSTMKKLESDEKLAKGPPLDLAKLAKLEARIVRLNTIKDSVAREMASHKQDNFRTEQRLPSPSLPSPSLVGGAARGDAASKGATKKEEIALLLVRSSPEVSKDEANVGTEEVKNFAEIQDRDLESKNSLKKEVSDGAPAKTRIEEEEGDESDGEGKADSKKDGSSDLETKNDEEEEGVVSEAEAIQADDFCVAKPDAEEVGTAGQNCPHMGDLVEPFGNEALGADGKTGEGGETDSEEGFAYVRDKENKGLECADVIATKHPDKEGAKPNVHGGASKIAPSSFPKELVSDKSVTSSDRNKKQKGDDSC
ncbi:hypothetical protein U1Q18_009850 [Sarracenia purpurea var. burkii]